MEKKESFHVLEFTTQQRDPLKKITERLLCGREWMWVFTVGPTQEEREALMGCGRGRGSDVAYHPSITNFGPSLPRMDQIKRERGDPLSPSPSQISIPHRMSSSRATRRAAARANIGFRIKVSALLNPDSRLLNLVSLHSCLVWATQQDSLHILNRHEGDSVFR